MCLIRIKDATKSVAEIEMIFLDLQGFQKKLYIPGVRGGKGYDPSIIDGGAIVLGHFPKNTHNNNQRNSIVPKETSRRRVRMSHLLGILH